MNKELEPDKIVFKKTGEYKYEFKAHEYFLSDGMLCYFNQPTKWDWAKENPRPIYERLKNA